MNNTFQGNIFFKLFLFAAILNLVSSSLVAQVDTVQKIVPGRKNSPEQQNKPYVILISIDGFRYDYVEKFSAKNLDQYGRSGVKAKSMIPAFPSKTFPNHYSIVTGLYPAHHGLVNNRFYDPARNAFYSFRDRKAVEDASWYGGIPLWVLAEQQSMITASFFWVGSEAPIKGIHPTYYYQYNEETPIEKRIQTVVNWLKLPAEVRPHLITFYFPELDKAGHKWGPEAPETRQTVLDVDVALSKLVDAVNSLRLDVNFIVVSDHGMTSIDVENTLHMPTAIDKSQFIYTGGDAIIELYAKDNKDILPAYNKLKQQEKNFTAYLKEDLPEHLVYSLNEDRFNRIGDIVLLSHHPYIFNFSERKPDPGYHGFDPGAVKDMQTIFYAWGPAFKKNKVLPSLKIVDVYPLIARILKLNYEHEIDGNIDNIVKILQSD